MIKLGIVTIGQAPRSDVTPILLRYLGDRVELVQAGVLDGLTREEIAEQFQPEPGDVVLTSRLLDGGSAVMEASKVEPVLQAKIEELEDRGCRHILVLCTGEFSRLRTRQAVLLEPDLLLPPIVAAIAGSRRFGVISPLPEQRQAILEKWAKFGLQPCFASASPYRYNEDEMRQACAEMKADAELVLLDCMGYTEEMRAFAAQESRLPVILSNALMAKIISEMI